MSTNKRTAKKSALIAALLAIAAFWGLVGTYTDILAKAYQLLTKHTFLDFFLSPSKPALVVVLIFAIAGFAWHPQLPTGTKFSRKLRLVQVSRILALTCSIYVAFIILYPKQMRVLYVVYDDNAPQIHPNGIEVSELAVQYIQTSDLKKLASIGDFRKGNIILSATDRPWQEVVAMLDETKIHASIYSLRESIPVSTHAPTDIGVSSYIAEFRRFLKSSPTSINNTLIVFERQYAEAENQLQTSLRADGGAKPSLVFDPEAPLIINGDKSPDVAFFLGSCAGLQLFSERAKTLKPEMAVIAPNWVRHRLTCTPASSTPTLNAIRSRRFCLVSATYEQLLAGDFRLWTQLLISLRDLNGTSMGGVYAGKEREHIAMAIGATDQIQLLEFK